MKVVLFCGGYGMRMRDGVSDLPKPMHPVGPRPLIWHVMRYYAHFGHTDFVLCLGYGAHHIKD
ncbi:MAG: glucose-phosphate cytidylyltransferase, partial [Pseudonocardia sp.]